MRESSYGINIKGSEELNKVTKKSELSYYRLLIIIIMKIVIIGLVR